MEPLIRRSARKLGAAFFCVRRLELPKQSAYSELICVATSGENKVSLVDVMFGDVYFCSGQSIIWSLL